MRKCGNCAKRKWHSWGSVEYCLDYEMACSEEEEIETAENCSRYTEETAEDKEEYIPSATAGDYGPGNPWDAPGMSVRDFI